MFRLLIVAILVASQTVYSEPITDKDALEDLVARLESWGIFLSSSGNCQQQWKPECTSLYGVQSQCIDELVRLKSSSECEIMIITGGTEVGHDDDKDETFTHSKGFKLDIEKQEDGCLSDHIKSTYTQTATDGDDHLLGEWSNGVSYYGDHGTHWDLTCTQTDDL